MSRLGGVIRRQWLPLAVLLLYLWALLVAPQRAGAALARGAESLAGVALLVLAVMGLVGLVQVWISRDLVARLLGKEAGWRALLTAVASGTLLIGPPYVIFPLLMSLRQQGARWAVITAVLGAYAVKVPMIPLEIQFLGTGFSLWRALLTMACAIPLGLAVEAVMERRRPRPGP